MKVHSKVLRETCQVYGIWIYWDEYNEGLNTTYFLRERGCVGLTADSGSEVEIVEASLQSSFNFFQSSKHKGIFLLDKVFHDIDHFSSVINLEPDAIEEFEKSLSQYE